MKIKDGDEKITNVRDAIAIKVVTAAIIFSVSCGNSQFDLIIKSFVIDRDKGVHL